MKVSSLDSLQLFRHLKKDGIFLKTGRFITHVSSPIETVADGISALYGDYPLALKADFADFHIALRPPANIRRFFRPQVMFYVDCFTPFKPLGIDQAFPFFEWGLNWCVTTYTNTCLIIHAAVIEKNGFAMLLPGDPGAGKSTLCAALVSRGWRLLSDELTMVSLSDGSIIPLPRPISLKNESIEVIKDFSPDAFIGRVAHDTLKGTVAHMRAPVASVERTGETACPKWIVFPKYVPHSCLSFSAISKGEGAIRLINNAFNYSILSEIGFRTVKKLIKQCNCYTFEYSNLEEAVSHFNDLAS